MNKIHSILIFSLLLLVGISTHAQETEQKLEVENSKYVQSNAEFLLIEAEKFFLLEDYKKTLAFLEQSIEVDGENHAAFFKMAETQLILEDFELAQKAIDKAITIRKDIKYYYVLAAEIMKAKKDMVQATVYYNLMVENTDDYFNYTKSIGDAYLAIEQPEEALNIYNKVEQGKGLTTEQKLGKIEALEQLEDTPTLELYLSKQIDNGSSDQMIIRKYVETLSKLGKTDQALAYLNEQEKLPEFLVMKKYELLTKTSDQATQEDFIILSTNDESLSIYIKTQMLGQYVISNRSFEDLKFADSVQNLINTDYPNDALAIQSSAMLYNLMATKAPIDERNYFNQKSVESYRQLVRLDPNDFRAWIKILDFERDQGLFEALEKDAEEALDLFPNQAVLYTYYAAAYAGQSDFDEAASLLQQAMRMSFGNQSLQSLIYTEEAELALLKGDGKAARSLFEKAVGIETIHPSAILKYCNYLLEVEPQKAIDLVDPYIAQGSKNIELFRIKAQAIFNLTKYSGANKFWDKNIEANSTNLTGPILELKGDILAKLNLTEEAVRYWEQAKSSGQASNKIDQKIANKAYQ